MWNTLKRLFAGDANQNAATGKPAADLGSISEPELVSMNQELARAQDAIRDQRRAINTELALRRAGFTVNGQTLAALASILAGSASASASGALPVYFTHSSHSPRKAVRLH